MPVLFAWIELLKEEASSIVMSKLAINLKEIVLDEEDASEVGFLFYSHSDFPTAALSSLCRRIVCSLFFSGHFSIFFETSNFQPRNSVSDLLKIFIEYNEKATQKDFECEWYDCEVGFYC